MLPHITTSLNGHVTLWLGTSPLGHHVTNFGGFRHCVRGNKMISICHVISRDHVFKGLSDFIGESPP